MHRRQFGTLLLGALLPAILVRQSSAQAKPFVLRIVRGMDWEQLMQRELCIPGTVYSVDPDRTQSDRPGTMICYSMELPLRANQNEISAIPRGTYTARSRLSEKNGPVIELVNVPKRDVIQMHSGNEINHTLGCILLGSTPVSRAAQQGSEILTAGKCWIAGSKSARDKLLALYGWTDLEKQPPGRPVAVIVE
jgi:uncharacterized protein DUF5675